MNGSRRGACELLEDDRASQGLKSLGSMRNEQRPDLIDDAAKDGIGALEMGDGVAGVWGEDGFGAGQSFTPCRDEARARLFRSASGASD